MSQEENDPRLSKNLTALQNKGFNVSVFSSQSLGIKIEIIFILKADFACKII